MDGHISFAGWDAYRRLYEASLNARYLELWQTKSGRNAAAYFSDAAARGFVQQELVTIQREFGY